VSERSNQALNATGFGPRVNARSLDGQVSVRSPDFSEWV
jgi:hypothetical protein